MARYKPQDHNSLLLPVVLSDQIIPGTFAFALDYLVDHELDLKPLDAQFKNDEVGASAYDPRVMLKIILLAYSQGLISSRDIEQACQRNVQFIALSGDSQPSHTHIAKFVANLGTQIKPLFAQVLLTCDAQGLIGRDMFAIDGVKLPSNASKERSGIAWCTTLRSWQTVGTTDGKGNTAKLPHQASERQRSMRECFLQKNCGTGTESNDRNSMECYEQDRRCRKTSFAQLR
jgi:transposase